MEPIHGNGNAGVELPTIMGNDLFLKDVVAIGFRREIFEFVNQIKNVLGTHPDVLFYVEVRVEGKFLWQITDHQIAPAGD